jgi:AcrR family transcriptional regulator
VKTRTPRGTARQRLAETAAEEFYRHGVTASGVDTIAARAGVSKPTLYAHFRSKTELVAAALEHQHATRRGQVERHLASLAGVPARERLLALFDWLAAHQAATGHRGCAFVDAAAELTGAADDAPRAVARAHKGWWCGLLAGLAAEAGAADPEALGEELLLLIDGANARVLVEGDAAPVARAQDIADVLITARTHGPAGGGHS